MDSGTASSRIWRTLNACASVVLALATARLNGSVCAAPNSSTARANSLSLVRTALSTSTTIALERSSSASIGTAANAFGSDGIHPLGRGELGFAPLAPAPAHPPPQRQDREGEDRQRDEQAEPGDAGARRRARRRGRGVQPVGRGDRRPGPVALAAAQVRWSLRRSVAGVGLAHDGRIGTWNA